MGLLKLRVAPNGALGIHPKGLGLRVWGLGFRVWGLGFRVYSPEGEFRFRRPYLEPSRNRGRFE